MKVAAAASASRIGSCEPDNMTAPRSNRELVVGSVIAAGTFRGGRLVRSDPAPNRRRQQETEPNGEPKKPPMVLDDVSDDRLITVLSERWHIPEPKFREWRESSRIGLSDVLPLERATVGGELARRPRTVARPTARGCVLGTLAEAASRRARLEHAGRPWSRDPTEGATGSRRV